MTMKVTSQTLYNMLLEEFGSLNWWPMDQKYHDKFNSDPRFEVIVGAILTQNTAWSNVEKALDNLKLERMLNVKKISKINIKILQRMVRPSGFQTKSKPSKKSCITPTKQLQRKSRQIF